MLKNKILKILPYWLISLSLVISLQGAAALITKSPNNSPGAVFEPQVLGANTSIRGDAPSGQFEYKKVSEPDLSAVTAKSYLVFDLETGENLLEKDSDKKSSIASLTKLLTGLTVYNNSDLNASFTVNPKALIKVSPVLNLRAGDEVKALDVFSAMLIGSCNDAALALAYFTGGSKDAFVSLMNEQAEKIGMKNSSFANPLGFDSVANYSTAADLKLLISQTEKLSAFSSLGRKTSYDFSGKFGNNYHATATNKLISNHSDIKAIKTGYTDASGGAMASLVQKQGRQMVILVLESANREQDTLRLKTALETGFDWN